MKFTPPKFESLSQMAAIDVGRLTEDEARAMLENIRWPSGPTCAHCGSVNVTRLLAKSKKVRDGVLQCNDCRGQFTVTVGTVMHGSHITLRQWVQAFHSMCSHKKGVSALQLQRNLGLHTYRSAWHLAHRIRLAMTQIDDGTLMNGTVEVDETWVGGKPRKGSNRAPHTTTKVPVLVLVERGGRARAQMIDRVTIMNLKDALVANVDKKARIITDELPAHGLACTPFEGGHERVNHSIGEYARGDVTTNSAESWFAILKRGVHGTFHHVSKRHLHRYADEFAFRWTHRKTTDGQRAVEAIKGCGGKRLAYRKTA